jgi:plastocyanin
MRLPRSSAKRVVALTAFAVVVAACGGSSSSGSSYKEPAGPPVATLKVESGNVFFKPTKLTAPPGIVKIILKNIESGTHDFVIRGVPGFDLQVSGSGSTAAKKVELKKGTFTFYCSIPGHEEAGMKGTLTVS